MDKIRFARHRQLDALKQKSDKTRMWAKPALMKGPQQIVADMTKKEKRKMDGPLFIVSDTNPVIWERVSSNNPSSPSCREATPHDTT